MAEAPNPASDPHPPPMDVPAAEPDDAAASNWDWGSLLDFAIDEDDPLILSWGDSPPPISNQPVDLAPASSRVRKRDPRLVCENYLAGRVPCACPEMDAMELEGEGEDEEEAVAAGGKKRARAEGAVARCQVPGCEVDIGELKGYHRRHRVCLRCANASSVVIDGEDKRYCQQCGKFHILPDFDEGKRSCRRKLERHNKRRRRKPTGGRNIMEKEKDSQGNWSGDITCDAEPRKDVSNGFLSESVETVVSNKVMEKEMFVESEDGHGSPNCSLPNSQNVQSNSIVTVAASDGDHIDERIDNTKSSFSSTLSDNKSIYSSVCQTGRISFKLYDWNPAEFPRRLRHQIFEWLANMPVELEGYIRPGCTILTVFIAMPQFMWEKLHEDVALYVRDLVNAPESLFLGKGNFLIYLGNRIVQILKDGTSLVNIEMNVKAPQLHYIYPSYFDAGKPMEFFACGSNLDQPKLRFLVSFAGKYLAYDSCHALSHGKIRSYHGSVRDSFNNSDHEFFRISIFRTDSEVFGPAFIEVENESGLSNFLPILFGSKHICSELERMQETSSESASTNSIMSQITVSGVSPSLCKHFVSKQGAISELLLDIAWLLKNPCSDTDEFILTSTNIQRLTCLLQFAIKNELVSVLKVIQHYVDNIQRLDKSVNMASKADLGLLLKNLSHAREFLDRRDPVHGLLMPESYNQTEVVCILPWTDQDVESRSRDSLVSTRSSASPIDEENIPLVTEQIIHRQRKGYSSHIGMGWPQEGWPNNVFPWKAASGAQLAVFVMFGVVACFGACVALIHPHKARDFAISIRRGLFGGPLT